MSVKKEYIKYVSRNILAMLGISCYIIADTFFISKAAGTGGMAALNLVLPIYNIMFAIGSMLGMGAATMFSIEKARGGHDTERYFNNAVFFAIAAGAVFMAAGGIFPEKVISLMGGDDEIMSVGTRYTRIFMLFAPFFMLNYVVNAFVRNDGRPTLSMISTLTGSFSNILLDYLFMFPFKMGMAGAALATGLSPVISIAVCLPHFFSTKSSVRFGMKIPSVRRLSDSCKVGISAFMGEISSGVITVCFNFIILGLAGNIGVAAYGVISNLALVATAVFNGIAQGSQPLISRFHGADDKRSCQEVLKMAIIRAEGAAAIILCTALIFAPQLTAVFNSEHSSEMAAYAESGMRIYFTGFIFAGFNIAVSGYMSASAKAIPAAVISVMRGFALITAFAFILSAFMGITGTWLAFPAAELVTAVTAIMFLRKNKMNR